MIQLALMLRNFNRQLARERAQGALEYIAIVVGIVILVAIGFGIAGVNIFEEASCFVQDVISASELENETCVPPDTPR